MNFENKMENKLCHKLQVFNIRPMACLSLNENGKREGQFANLIMIWFVVPIMRIVQNLTDYFHSAFHILGRQGFTKKNFFFPNIKLCGLPKV